MDNNIAMYLSQSDKKKRQRPGMANQQQRNRQEAIAEYHRFQKSHNKCWYCMDSPKVCDYL